VTRRGSPLLWALLLAGPAIVLAALGFRSVEQADRIRRHEAADAAKALADEAMDAAVRRLAAIRGREEARAWFEYQTRYMPVDVAGVGPAFVQNSFEKLRGGASSPDRWFRYVLAQGRISGPDVADEGAASLGKAFLAAYDDVLRTKLTEAATSVDWAGARATPIPVEVVAANEEIGQLLEEVEVTQRVGKQTAYLDNFSNRMQQRGNAQPPASVSVRSTPTRYLSTADRRAGLAGGPAPALVAWRVAYVPASDAKARRDAPVDRWYLLGYAFDRPLQPDGADPRRVAGPQVWVGDPAAPATAGPEGTVRRLADRLAIERAASDDPVLRVVARPDTAELDAERSADRTRYLFTAAGLLSVVGVGLFVLGRSVRREMDAARRKQDFVAAVTHELKTPLAGIRMYADMLKEGWVEDGETTTTYADRIVGETKRLSGLVDQVLDFSALERGTGSFHPLPGDLGAAVRDAAELCRPASVEAGVPVRIEVEPGLPGVAFDANLVRPLVVNLVDNAIKYSARSATKDVLVSVRRDGNAVAMVVADRGVGIPEADRERVFEPFFRSGDEMTRTTRGVGIGLALVARYAKAHGATIALDSAVGRGTTVTVRFPR